MIDHDDTMRLHAARRGRVTVTQDVLRPGDRERPPFTGLLIAWRPNRTRTGANGQPIVRSTYTAVVQVDDTTTQCQYPLGRYHIEPITKGTR